MFRFRSFNAANGRGLSWACASLAGQRTEVQLACRVLNTMTGLGVPDSYRVG
jgi:hypothetical protein